MNFKILIVILVKNSLFVLLIFTKPKKIGFYEIIFYNLMRDDNNPAKYNDILCLQEIAYFADLVFSNLMVRIVKILFYNQSSYVIRTQ